jgi:hypothetical protein
MKTGDKIDFTPEQKAVILPLYATAIYARDAADAANERAARCHRHLWRTVREMLDLPRGRSYSMADDFAGILVSADDKLAGTMDYDAVLDAILDLEQRLRDRANEGAGKKDEP